MKTYNSWEDLKINHEDAAHMIERENNLQFPVAKFIKAFLGTGFTSDENYEDLIVLFDIGIKDHPLVITIPDPDNEEGSYIDEYYSMPISEAERWISFLK